MVADAALPEGQSVPSPSAKAPGETWQRQNGANAAGAEQKVLDWHAGWDSDGSAWDGPLAEVNRVSCPGRASYPALCKCWRLISRLHALHAVSALLHAQPSEHQMPLLPTQEGSDDGVDWEDAGDGVLDDTPAAPDAAGGDASVSGPLDIELDELQGAMDKQVGAV